MFKKIFFVVIFLFTSLPLLANDNNLYIDVNVGIANQDLNITSKSGTTVDDEDTGFMINLGSRISDNFSIEGMYYDMGDASIKGSANDTFVTEGLTYTWSSGGTLTSNTTGFGGALVGYLSTGDLLEIYGKLGIHSWDHSGSSTLLDNNDAFNSKFFDEGTDLYYGFGIDLNITNSLNINLGYDALNFADTFDPSADDYSSFLYGGIKYEF